ncbi:[Fe-Fe] hydrogenase large subunit C-terminal domain-containing protein [Paramaledivibacter caminithermalis]|jgi:iron only hydrogenase large subunit-like protein|uniref:Iron only hydrogenase large subunit, C-terminal domain n=1 Tax=Paramaledivibacter caminithermalis (strain DSM 15212 / CIP 107654 / DViRD3) TaxID=1121301 RepID=A0A1M6LYP4_PARC5|nr:[Fe-Fe] hydrogenase large subunit C-terminal domain-containing protein [Paramaledivibacter caminithermalis]SHJ76358.1 Iron only hydrogenase large subunit, C-terminal domain [Paramaledivibacter caminithermalis DSM 15212]
MGSSFHSVILKEDLCIGCTNCIKRCPTEAIRVRNGKAKIIESKCIDCGECIRRCPEHAKDSVSDSLDEIKTYKYKIALPAPSLYSQFGEKEDPGKILAALKAIGFDEIFEVSRAADIVSEYTKKIVAKSNIRPLLSSSCPVIVRLIQVRFPNLIKHILPIESPVEIAGIIARKRASEKLKIKPSDIGIFFISPCPAKVTSVKRPIGSKKSSVDGVISFKEIYPYIVRNLKLVKEPLPFYLSGKGIGWARAGGETFSLGISDYICVDGIENVIKILDDIEDGRLSGIRFAELLSCTNGCVGGVLTIENPFIARNRIRRLSESYLSEEPVLDYDLSEDDIYLKEEIIPIKNNVFGDNFVEAMKKMSECMEIKEQLPSLDCGACGSPSCQVMAEDIVLGETNMDDCMVLFKKKFEKSSKKEG